MNHDLYGYVILGLIALASLIAYCVMSAIESKERCNLVLLLLQKNGRMSLREIIDDLNESGFSISVPEFLSAAIELENEGLIVHTQEEYCYDGKPHPDYSNGDDPPLIIHSYRLTSQANR